MTFLNSPRRKVLALAVPIILSNITVPLLGIVDTAVVGHLDSPHYLGAVAIGALVFSYVFWMFGFLRQGTTGPVAQAHGSEDGQEIRAILGRALIMALVIGSALIVLQAPIKWAALTLIEASSTVEQEAARYIEIRIWAAPGALVQFVALGWLVGMHDTKSVMAVQILVNGINIVLDLLFVMGFGWGVAGVAAATLIAELGGAGFALWVISRRLKLMPGPWSWHAIKNWIALKRLMVINTDIMVRTLFLQSAFFIFTAQGAQYGDVVLAANAVLMNFLAIAAYGLDGFAHAAEALVGGAVGRRDRSAFGQAVRSSTELAVVVSGVTALVFAVAGIFLIQAMTSIEAVQLSAYEFLPWLVLSPLISVWSYQMDGVFFGATATREVRNMMVVCFTVFVASCFLSQPLMGNHGLWFSLMLLNGLRGVTLAVLLGRVRDRCTDPVPIQA